MTDAEKASLISDFLEYWSSAFAAADREREARLPEFVRMLDKLRATLAERD